MFRNKITCAEVKEIDMVTYLASIGYEPTKIRNHNYWYCSPLRTENDPSFKVNRKLNRWYDFGTGSGGSLIDFGILYYNCTIGDFLNNFKDFLPLRRHEIDSSLQIGATTSTISIDKVVSITSTGLLTYLRERRIPILIADKFCKEIRYIRNDKEYYSIGFKNDAGGYELRNKYSKLSTSPKSVTTLCDGHRILNVFEGFFDFLSFITLVEKYNFPPTDYLVLNSTAFFEKNLSVMLQYDQVNLFLNNDDAGQNCSQLALSQSSKFADQSGLYRKYNDLNEWLCFPGLHDD